MIILQLGYLHFEVSDIEAWERFGAEVLGTQIVGRQPDGAFGMRIDGWRQRFFVTPGPGDDLAAVGLMVEGPEGLEAVVQRVRAAGLEVEEGNHEQAQARGVEALASFYEPGGIRLEVFYGPVMASEPLSLSPMVSGFVAGDRGLGHCVLRAAPSLEESEEFFMGVLGFKLSDRIICDLGGYKVNITFTHINPRHHSVALGAGLPKRIHHFMLQATTLDDVGRAFDRVVDHRLRVTQTLGRHPNDKMVSFYAQTPSGFEFEYGWGAREVDDATWEPQVYDHISEWGHRRPPYRRPKT